eukprot:973370-Amphidinium_carterae.2
MALRLVGRPLGPGGRSLWSSWLMVARKGHGRGSIRNLCMMADRLNWTPIADGWRQGDHNFA